jgi:large subunit ribosomal protein L32
MRRAANDKIVVPNLVPCPKCSEPMVPHRVCPSCGHYKGRKITDVEEPGTSSSE